MTEWLTINGQRFTSAEARKLKKRSAKLPATVQRLPAVFQANRCIVVGIDAGKQSGFGTGDGLNGKAHLQHVQRCITHDDRVQALAAAKAVAEHHQVPLIIVGEKWQKHGKWSFAASVGTGAQWGKWEVAIEAVGTFKLGRTKWPKVVRVVPPDWRGDLFCERFPKTERAKALAVARVSAELGIDQANIDHNAAEAGCIVLWGLHSGRVAALLKGQP